MAVTRCTYICPVRFSSLDEAVATEFSQYWQFLEEQGCEVLVVDGSPPEVFRVHAEMWTASRHIEVDKEFTFLNGKVNGVMTGVREASHEKIILADDDIRYTTADIDRMVEGLEEYDLVRPQNYFQPLPWWAKIDAARALINRALLPEGDYPGTFGFRKSVFQEAGPFDGDVLFDNEELVKHLVNHSANIRYANDFFILRRPPTMEKWFEQRPRQAYEDFVMKEKTGFFLMLLPIHLLLGLLGKRSALRQLFFMIAGISIGLALHGRKGEAHRYFPVQAAFFAPLWVLERAISVYIALYWRYARDGYPFGGVIIRKGTGRAWEKSPIVEE